MSSRRWVRYLRRSELASARLRSNCVLFLGASSPEVLGDYGVGPNHTLPTGGTARFACGLSVLNFLCARTWIEIDSAEQARELYEDATVLTQMEGLAAHRRAAEMRLGPDLGARERQ